MGGCLVFFSFCTCADMPRKDCCFILSCWPHHKSGPLMQVVALAVWRINLASDSGTATALLTLPWLQCLGRPAGVHSTFRKGVWKSPVQNLLSFASTGLIAEPANMIHRGSCPQGIRPLGFARHFGLS